MNGGNIVLKCQKCNHCLKGKKSLGLFSEGLRDNDSKKPQARKFYQHRSFNNVWKWTNTLNLNSALLRSTCISELNIIQNYNLLAQEIVLLLTNEYLTNIFFFIFHPVAVVGLKCLQGLYFCQLSGTHWTTSPSIALESVPMEALLLPTFFALFLWTVLLPYQFFGFGIHCISKFGV